MATFSEHQQRMLDQGRSIEEVRQYRPSVPVSSPDPGDAIGPGDKVTFIDRFGVSRTGRAVMRGPHGWVLNMGGKHGTPAVPNPASITMVKKARKPGPRI